LPNRPHDPVTNDLQEVAARHHLARDLTETAAAEHPDGIWQDLLTAFGDIPALTTEISRLRRDLAGARLDRANLAAAALAAVTAHGDGEPDPLCYLRDELHAQGYDVTGSRGSR
jgi:hypothetical protein